MHESELFKSISHSFHFYFLVPTVGPSFQQEVDASRVTLTWAELPRAQRGGCITQYTIYLEDANGSVQQCKKTQNEYLDRVDFYLIDIVDLQTRLKRPGGDLCWRTFVRVPTAYG